MTVAMEYLRVAVIGKKLWRHEDVFSYFFFNSFPFRLLVH